jgi:hypothetical protein
MVMLSNQMASWSLFPLPASSLHPGCADHTLFFCRFNTIEKDRPILVYVLCIVNPQFFLSSLRIPAPTLNRYLFFTVTVPSFCHFPSLCLYFFLLTLGVSLFPICSHLYLCGRRHCLARRASKTLGSNIFPLINTANHRLVLTTRTDGSPTVVMAIMQRETQTWVYRKLLIKRYGYPFHASHTDKTLLHCRQATDIVLLNPNPPAPVCRNGL